MEKGILAIDLGTGSIGLAISRSGSFVTPLPEKRFKIGDYEEAYKAIADIVSKEEVLSFVIGYPLFPSGDPCEMTSIVEEFASRLEEEYPNKPIYKQDERNSTVEAASLFHAAGSNSKKQKKKIDSGAAAVILTRYLKSIGQM